jgi:nucleoside-diphosphate-sugar epimerase
MRVLVTGANGFIGSAISEELSKRGHIVTGVVRRIDSGKSLKWEPLQSDLESLETLMNSLDGKYFDIVIDAAAKIPHGASSDDYFDNIVMSRNVLKALENQPPLYFVKLSTVDVYRISDVITESSEVAPQNYYALSKRVGEQFVELWGLKSGVPTCVLRLCQIFGKGDLSKKFIPSIIKSIKKTGTVIINGDGMDLRDYLFVEDLGRITADFCEHKTAGTFNIASGNSQSLNQVVDILKEIAEKDFQIEHRNQTKPRLDYVFDIRKLIETLGAPKLTPLRVALKKTYYESN